MTSNRGGRCGYHWETCTYRAWALLAMALVGVIACRYEDPLGLRLPCEEDRDCEEGLECFPEPRLEELGEMVCLIPCSESSECRAPGSGCLPGGYCEPDGK